MKHYTRTLIIVATCISLLLVLLLAGCADHIAEPDKMVLTFEGSKT